jgi:hypothetical protein
MRRFAVAVLVAMSLATVAQAQSSGPGGASYTNVSGRHVHRPMRASHRPSGATAKCRDGTWSFSQHHLGTCSHHGGVSAWE